MYLNSPDAHSMASAYRRADLERWAARERLSAMARQHPIGAADRLAWAARQRAALARGRRMAGGVVIRFGIWLGGTPKSAPADQSSPA